MNSEKILCAAIWYKDFPLIKDSEMPDGICFLWTYMVFYPKIKISFKIW